MNFPKLKNPLLCRILVYVVVLGVFIIPLLVVLYIDAIPSGIKIACTIISIGLLLVYMVKNLVFLMVLDSFLAYYCTLKTARTKYSLPENCTADLIENRVSAIGSKQTPINTLPQPSSLRYAFKSSLTINYSGLEKIVATYNTDFLDEDTYKKIIYSANLNSNALKGKKKALFLDKEQKTAPLNRTTVVIILAKSVDINLSIHLYDKLCKQVGDENNNALIPCVVDFQSKTCVFNSCREITLDTETPSKNRGIGLIKKLVFGGKLPLENNENYLEEIKNYNTEQTLWDFWREIKKESKNSDKEIRKQFEQMSHKEVYWNKEEFYLKWEQNGVFLALEFDEENKVVTTFDIAYWSYPKSSNIPKKTIKEIKSFIDDYFSQKGYQIKYIDFFDDKE